MNSLKGESESGGGGADQMRSDLEPCRPCWACPMVCGKARAAHDLREAGAELGKTVQLGRTLIGADQQDGT